MDVRRNPAHAGSARLAGLLCATALLAVSCGDDGAGSAFGGPAVHTVRRGDLRITLDQKAELQAAVKTNINSRIQGWSALLYLIPEGTEVEAGAVLAELDVSSKEERRAEQAIRVGRGASSLEQARKNLEIVEAGLQAAENAARSQLIIARMELQKFLGKAVEIPPDQQVSVAGTNLEMVQKLQEMLAAEFQINPEAEVEYAGLADRVRDLLGEDNLYRAMGQTANQVLDRIDQIRLARADLELKRDTLEHSEVLADKGFITRNELERDRLAFESQLSRVTLAWNNLDLLINYTLRQDQIRLEQDVLKADLALENTIARNEAQRVRERAEVIAKELEYELARERLENLDMQIASAVVRAPHGGVVVYGKQRRDRYAPPIEEGMNVRENQTLVILPDVSRMVAEFDIHESQIQRVYPGQEVTLGIDAFPDRGFTGRVTNIANIASTARSHMSTNALKTYKTVVTVDGENRDGALRPGMNANVQILIDVVENVVTVPIEAVQRRLDVHYVWKQTAAGPESHQVRLGRSNTSHVVIEDGVFEGDRVLLSAPLDAATPEFARPAGQAVAGEAQGG